jgi:hypothetical protein
MEMFQILWDDQKKLFLEFEKDDEEKDLYLPERIKYVNIQLEISKIIGQDILSRPPPLLVSIKRIYHSNECLSFAIELDDFANINDLQIKVLRVIIFLFSGEKFEYKFSEKFKLADIWMNEDCYVGYQIEDLGPKRTFKSTITHKKVICQVQKDYANNKEKKTTIIEKKKVENVLDGGSISSLIQANNDTLKVIANELKNLTAVLKNVSLNAGTNYLPSGPPIRSSSGPPIKRIQSTPSISSLMGGSSAKVMVIREMKSVFQKNIEENSDFNVQKLLKPMSEEELNKIMLSEEELLKKEEIAIQKQIERFKRSQEKELVLEDLRKPE